MTESAAETPQEKTSLSGEEQKISRIVSQLFDLMIASCPYADMAARCLSALKPSVLGLAQGDPEFLNTREHPARLLLNDVVTGLSQADDPDAFVAEVLLLAGRLEGRLESRLLQSQVDATRIFEEELQAFRDQLEGVSVAAYSSKGCVRPRAIGPERIWPENMSLKRLKALLKVLLPAGQYLMWFSSYC